MNERIKELAEKAGLEFDDDLVLEPEPIYYTTQKDLEKFAELIAQECIDVLKARYMGDQNREDMEVRRCIEDVKKHFGVE